MATCSPTEALGLRGRFAVRCGINAEGTTVVRREEVSAPFHLSKPYWTGDVLVLQAVNATAGVFAGDRLGLSLEVEPGARALLTSPSAARIHTMPRGRAEQAQTFKVGRGAWLEVMPELFIPQAGCRYHQHTEIEVAPGGTLFFVETLAPGRTARGESLAFDEVRWSLDLRRDGRLMVRERYALRGGNHPSTWCLRHPFQAGYFASISIVADGLDLAPLRSALSAGSGSTAWLGLTQPDPHVWLIKMLAADSATLRHVLLGLRRALVPVLPHLAADARKL